MSIYRKDALDKLSSPDQLDSMMILLPSSVWLILLAAGVLIGGGLLWSLLSTVPVTVSGFGVLTRAGSTAQITAPAASKVQTILVDIGAEVPKGQPVMVMADGSKIIAPITGRILTTVVNPGDSVTSGAALATMESTDDATNPLQAILFVNAIDGQAIQPGMDVQLAPSTVRTQETGFLQGKVKSVDKAPVSPERISRLLGSSQMAAQESNGEALIEVQVELTLAPNTPSGYVWSSAQGSPFKLTSGTFSGGAVILGQQHPISLLFNG